MARPPHKLKKDKLLEGVGGLRIQDEVGAKIHKLKRLRLHAKLLLADNVRGASLARSTSPRELRQPAGMRHRSGR
jgi:hypothetical protein